MPSTFSPALRLELIGNGEQAANWGNTTNTNLGTLLEQAITGVGNIAMPDANYTLISGNGISDEARNAVLVVTGTLSTTRNLVVPSSNKLYAVRNNTSGGQSILVKTSAGSGVTIANGLVQIVYCDGTNVFPVSSAVNQSTGLLVLNNPTINGFTGDTSVINVGNGQFYKDVSGNISIGGASTGAKLQIKQDQADYSYVDLINETPGGGTVFRQVVRNISNTGFTSVDFASIIGGGASINSNDTHPNNFIVFGVGASEKMRINSFGHVGIGTSIPTSPLTVKSQGVDSIAIRVLESASGVGILQFTNDPVTLERGSILVNNTGTMRLSGSVVEFSTSAARRMLIDSFGNVGIGTTSPTQKLDVVGNVNVVGNINVTGNITAGNTTPVPSGSILEFAGFSPPAGWLFCDGSQVSRSTYANLFSVIGTAYGAGDGFSTFNLPDRRNRVGIGAGSSYSRGATGGATSATTSAAGAHNHGGVTGQTALTTNQIPSHVHTGSTSVNGDHSHSLPGQTITNAPGFAGGVAYGYAGNTTGVAGAHNHSFTTNATGGNQGHSHSISTEGNHTHTVSTLPPYLASNYIIKT